MTDIYDIKYLIFGEPISILKTVLVFVLFLLLYFLIFKRRKIIDTKKLEDFEEIDENKQKTDFKEVINIFGKNYISLNSSEFLKQISFIFRTFLEEEKGYKNFSKLTLEEIISFSNEEKSLGENNFINILKSIYFAEYEGIEITKEHKKELFEKVENIILNEKI